ncbi:MAG: hypothetical protein ABIB43_01245 [archaeon]
MSKHGHDLHYMVIVLVLAFFVFALAVNRMDVELTGHVVTSTERTDNFINFFKNANEPNEFPLLSFNELFEPIALENSDFSWSDLFTEEENDNVGGAAVQTSPAIVYVGNGCNWINLDNERYDRLKTLSGNAACRVSGYKSCMMTNSLKTTSYYSNDCFDLMYKDNYNVFGNCDDRITTTSTLCVDGVKESSYVSVFCCN